MADRVAGFQLALRAALAAGAALGLAQLLRLDYPLYAMIAAVIVTDLSQLQTRQLGLRRLMATVVGAGCGALLVPWLPDGAASVAGAIFVAMLICVALGAPEASKVAGYICGIVVLSHAAEGWMYALLRLVETALGVAVAWAISLVPKLLRPREEKEGVT